jgi:hypothetical protein
MSYNSSIPIRRGVGASSYLVEKAIAVWDTKLARDISARRLHNDVDCKSRSHTRSGNECPT